MFGFLNPNPEQVKSAIRWAINTFGVVFATWFAAKGWFSVDQITSVLNSETVIGIAVSGIMFIINMIAHKQSSTIAAAAEIAKDSTTPLKGLITTNDNAGRALAESIPGATVATAGTVQAAAIAGH